ncbi:MAG TPA: TolC family protein [Bacteroidota bacterium]|nr:TolC family protein [Bacteroidota bacterium]
MRFARMRAFVALLLVAPFTDILGQDTLRLTLDQSVSLALERSPELAVARNEYEKAGAGVWQAWSTVLPRLDGYASLQHSWEIQTSRIPNFLKPMLGPLGTMIPGVSEMPDYVDIAFGLENTLRYGATVTQPLFLGGAGMAGIRMANASERAAEHALELRRQTLVLDAATAFYAVLLAQELARVQENALAQAQANLETVTKKFDVGMASPFDKMRAQVDVATIEPDVIAARNALQSSLSTLRIVLGLEPSTRIDVQGEFLYAPEEYALQPLSELQAMALARRRESKIMEERKAIADNSITIARSGHWPTLIFQTDLSYLGMRDDYRFSGPDLSKGITSSLTLQLPIFAGFKTMKESEKAELEYKSVLEDDRRLVNGICAEVEVTLNGVHEADQKYRSALQTVKLGTEALRLANVMYREGANTQLDVLNSQLALTRAQVNYANTMFEYQVARYRLRKAIGHLNGVL